MVRKMDVIPKPVAVVFALVAASAPLAAPLPWMAPAAIATSGAVSFPLPNTVTQGTIVQIASANSMASVNLSLKQQFEQKFKGTRVSITSRRVDQALQDVLTGKADLAAIGRPLSDAETAQGLVPIPVGRDKIAIVVGAANPFNKDLSIPKFAKIFRGEIKNWADLGGSKGAIVFVDRVNSDARQAFLAYPAFQTGKFTTGSNAVKLEDPSMNALLEKLGTQGISFVSANQLKRQKGLRALTMDKVDPNNAKYPFSQPLFYVYKGAPNASVKAFLGLAGSPVGQQAIQKAGVAQVIDFNQPGAASDTNQPGTSKTAAVNKAVPENAPKGTTSQPLKAKPPTGATGEQIEPAQPNASPATPDTGETNLLGIPVPSWIKWLLPVGLLGLGLVLLLLPRKQSPEEPIEGTIDPEIPPTRLTPPDETDLTQDAWVEPSASASTSEPPRFMATPLDGTSGATPPTEGTLGADAIVGGITAAGAAGAAWSFLHHEQPQTPDAASEASPTLMPPGETVAELPIADHDWSFEAAPAESAEGEAGTAATARNRLLDERNRVVLIPQTAREAVVRWQLTDAQKSEAHNQGGVDLVLRLYDVTGISPEAELLENFYQYDCSELTQELRIELPLPGRDYVVEVGYLDREGEWLGLARSIAVQIPAV